MATGDRAARIACFAALILAAAPAPMALTTRGLGPVRFGMTVRQAEAALGSRLHVEYPNDKSCSEGATNTPDHLSVIYLFEDGQLARIAVFEHGSGPVGRTVTAAGIGLGAREADVRRRFPGASIEPHKYDEDGHYVELRGPGNRGILLETHRGRVIALSAGLYPALQYVEGCL